MIRARRLLWRRSGGRFPIVLALGAAVTCAAACSDPDRPTFGPFPYGPDTLPPTIEFLAPLGSDSVFPAGSRILVQVAVRDRTPIRSVASGVLGAVVFGFPTLFPDDTVFAADFPITTPAGVTGAITFRVVATDTLGNRSDADRHFILQ